MNYIHCAIFTEAVAFLWFAINLKAAGFEDEQQYKNFQFFFAQPRKAKVQHSVSTFILSPVFLF